MWRNSGHKKIFMRPKIYFMSGKVIKSTKTAFIVLSIGKNVLEST